ncbi:MAG: phytanoyl-CoA dioxygenase family protein [Bryobacterales bacterium]|nr:phytanoyl-CoA dioxygenase family protein [Acidobacteriota bacterium]MCB9383770.1 phytanoyl-CoA dioxygenase family protein [Bryobacterales bacterium]
MAGPLSTEGFATESQGLPSRDVEGLLTSFAAEVPEAQTERVAGIRRLLHRSQTVHQLSTGGVLGEIAHHHLGPKAFPVRAILFDKSVNANWVVPFHQDVTIPVQKRQEATGFGPWSVKDGVPHVQPPSAVLEGMLTLRLHLDDVDETNGPLLVFPGSHSSGILAESRVFALQRSAEPFPCLARRGDILLMRPLLVHGSHKASAPSRRRVLHVEFAARPLPASLAWGRS